MSINKYILLFIIFILLLIASNQINAVGVSGENFTGTFEFRIPPTAITNLQAHLESGGDLKENKTYFYVATAVDKTGHYVWDNAHSGISNEIMIQTNQTHKSVMLNWSSLDINHKATTIYRSEVSDSYAYHYGNTLYNCTRIGSRNDYYASCYNPTVGSIQNHFKDNNSIPLYKKCLAQIPSVLPLKLFITSVPPRYNFPLNFNPRINGYSVFNFWNGTAGDRVSFEDIIQWAWENGYTNYFYYDGINFGSLGNWIVSGSNELHFKETKAHWLHIGSFSIRNSNSNSEFILGNLQNGLGKDGVRFTFMNTGNGIMNLNSPSIEFYDNYLTATPSLFLQYNGVFSSAYIQLYNVKSFLDWKGIGISYFNVRKDIPLKDIVAIGPSYVSPIYNNMSLSENIKTTGIFYPNYRHQYRIDKFISYFTSRQMYLKTQNITFIDPYSPNSNYDKWYAYGAFLSPRTAIYRQYNSLIIKVLDTDGTPLVVNVSVDNKNGDALDFDKTFDYTKIETDSEGFLWREKIDITSATINTITDSSKSWGTNIWKGRNVMFVTGDVIGEQAKVMSNTADTLTFTFDLLKIPSAGDKAGIIAEIQTVEQDYTNGQVLFNPFTITIERAGKQDYVMEFNVSDNFIINRDNMLLFRLRDTVPPTTVYQPTMITIGRGGIFI